MDQATALLHARYLASFPDKVEDLQAMRAVFCERLEPATVDALHVPVHRLAGSAPAYGFDDLGVLARHADRLLQPHARGGELPNADQIRAIDAAVQDLIAGLRAAMT